MKIHIITELEENLQISETTKWRHSMEKPMIHQKRIHPGSFNCCGEGDHRHSSNWWSSFSHRIKMQLLLLLSRVYTVWVCSCCYYWVESTQCEFDYLLTLATSNIWRCLLSPRWVVPLDHFQVHSQQHSSLACFQEMRKHDLQDPRLELTRLSSQKLVSRPWRERCCFRHILNFKWKVSNSNLGWYQLIIKSCRTWLKALFPSLPH